MRLILSGLARILVLVLGAGLLVAGCGDDEENPPDGNGPEPGGKLLVNEFLAVNNTIVADEYGEFDDWVELWNEGPGDAATAGLYLTDDYEQPLRWALPDTSIAEGGHLLIWADADADSGQAPWHTTFRLSGSGGEEIGLYRLEQTGPALIDSVTFSVQSADVSLARQPDGGGWVADPTPTPGASND